MGEKARKVLTPIGLLALFAVLAWFLLFRMGAPPSAVVARAKERLELASRLAETLAPTCPPYASASNERVAGIASVAEGTELATAEDVVDVQTWCWRPRPRVEVLNTTGVHFRRLHPERALPDAEPSIRWTLEGAWRGAKPPPADNGAQVYYYGESTAAFGLSVRRPAPDGSYAEVLVTLRAP